MGRQKGGYIGGRIGTELRLRLTEIFRKHGPNDTTMLEDALGALADYVERAGKYERPMKMVFDADADAFQRQQVAEGKEPTAMIKRLVSDAQKASGTPGQGKPNRAERK